MAQRARNASRDIRSQRATFLDRLTVESPGPRFAPTRTSAPVTGSSRAANVPNHTAAAQPGPQRTSNIATPTAAPSQSVRPSAVGASSYDCIACADIFPTPPAAVIQTLTICQECFDAFVRPLFERHLADETAPVIWSGKEVSIDEVEHQFDEGFVEHYRARVREYVTPPDQRLYCAGTACDKFLGMKTAASQSKFEKRICPECKETTCSKCTALLANRNARHVCSTSVTAGPSRQEKTTDELLRGQQRGRDYQKCPRCNLVCFLAEACNHITCPRPNCRAEFCYVCGGLAGDFSGHWSLPGEPAMSSRGRVGRCKLYGLPSAQPQPANADDVEAAQEGDKEKAGSWKGKEREETESEEVPSSSFQAAAVQPAANRSLSINPDFEKQFAARIQQDRNQQQVFFAGRGRGGQHRRGNRLLRGGGYEGLNGMRYGMGFWGGFGI